MLNKITIEKIEALRHSARLVVRELGLLKDAYFDIGVTLAERHLLVEVASSLYPDVGNIAKKLLLDKSTVSRLIAKAVKKELIICIIDENDRRRRCLQLTKKGQQMLNAIEPLAQGQIRDALTTMNEEEMQTVHQGMHLFSKALAKARLRKEFVIEPIAPSNNVPLAQLIISTLEEYDYNKPGFASDDTELQALFEAYQKKGCAYFVIKRKNKVVGGAGIAPLQGGKPNVCELRKMYLLEDLRGAGLGELLLEACLSNAKRQGYHTCYLETATKMTQAQNFYLRNGFKRIGKRKGNTGHFGCDIFFEKKL